jgi:ribonuclease J
MKLTIHRGCREIGGSCVEISSGGTRILIDLGLPLVDANMERFDSLEIGGKSQEDLIASRVLPNIKGLYKGERPDFDAILLSHPHQDHYGVLSFVNPDIPVYMSEGCRKLIRASHFFGYTGFEATNVRAVEGWKQLRIGDFVITPYPVDHSGFAALAFLVEAEGRRIFYSGDFRRHGRKGVLFENVLKRPPRDISYLLLEGSMLGRAPGAYRSEEDVENKLVELFTSKNEQFFLACSSQNIDRIVSVYRACLKTGRILVLDPYTTFILDSLKEISPHIPQFNWGENIRVFFVQNTHTKRMADNKSLFKFKSAKITFGQMQDMRAKLVIKDAWKTKRIFAQQKRLENTTLIHSMWEGYLPDTKAFWQENNVPILKVHCSGHAYVEDLKAFAAALEPGCIVPIHTFAPQEYGELFAGHEIKMLKDGQEVEI